MLYMLRRVFTTLFLAHAFVCTATAQESRIDSFRLYGDVTITIDQPVPFYRNQKTIVVFYALPNGNTTCQTMGKVIQAGDDWHFDIQHIKAQTRFVRNQLQNRNFVVIYLENSFRSWPLWKQMHSNARELIKKMVDSVTSIIPGKDKRIYLNGHSGGGSFIFGYLAAVQRIPGNVKRISFIDSNYGYDSTYLTKLRQWLTDVKGAALNVFAYNDSIALYNRKPVVSATGGTWYKGHLMLRDLQNFLLFQKTNTDSLVMYKSRKRNVQFYFKINTDRGIYHTQQVELNGFIHSVLSGTKLDSKNYEYYGRRSYTHLIE